MELEQELAAARQKNLTRIKGLGFLTCVVGLGLGLIVFGTNWDFTWLNQSLVPPGQATPSVEPEPTQPVATNSSEPTGELAAVNPKRQGSDRPLLPIATPRQPKPASKPSDCEIDDSPDLNCDQVRALFKDELKAFEGQIEPRLKASSIDQWASDAHTTITNSKTAALTAFGQGDYLTALSEVRAATNQSLNVLKLRDVKFSRHLNAAVSAFDQNRYQLAQSEIDQALLLQPEHSTAQNYFSRIELMPKVLGHIEAATKARAENQFRLEETHLEKVVELDPERTKHKERLAFISAKILEEDFANHISASLSAIQSRDVGAARTSFNNARSIFPDRPEVAVLRGKLESLDRNLALETALGQANQAVAVDDWSLAHQAFSKAKSVDPFNTAAAEGERIAAELLAGQAGLKQFLDQPDRLSDEAVAAAARRSIEQVRLLVGLSPGLKADAALLSNLVERAAKLVEVVVMSDGKTDISVRRTGIVGKTVRKVIELRPGEYTFEGKRVGYRSKLIKLTVPPGGERVEVTVVCDEQL